MKKTRIFDVLVNGESVAKFIKHDEAIELIQKLEKALDKTKSVIELDSYEYGGSSKEGLE